MAGTEEVEVRIVVTSEPLDRKNKGCIMGAYMYRLPQGGMRALPDPSASPSPVLLLSLCVYDFFAVFTTADFLCSHRPFLFAGNVFPFASAL